MSGRGSPFRRDTAATAGGHRKDNLQYREKQKKSQAHQTGAGNRAEEKRGVVGQRKPRKCEPP